MGMWLSWRGMRFNQILFLVLFTSLGSGCAGLIMESGLSVSSLHTKESVRATFGEPDRSGDQFDVLLPEGCDFDEVITRRKLSHGAAKYAWIVPMTLGLSELVCVPYELGQMSYDSIVGQKIRFIYDVKGNVVQILVNDEIWWMKRQLKVE